MGFPIAKLTCTHCNRVEPAVIWTMPRVYQIDERTQIEVRYSLGWCFDCDGVQHIEDLAPQASFDVMQRCADTLRSATLKKKWLTKSWYCRGFSAFDDLEPVEKEFKTQDWHVMADALAHEMARLKFLTTRAEPARCLKCHGHNIAEMTIRTIGDRTVQLHPGCQGHFEFQMTGSMNLRPVYTQRVYRPHGIFSHEEPYEPPAGPYDQFDPASA